MMKKSLLINGEKVEFDLDKSGPASAKVIYHNTESSAHVIKTNETSSFDVVEIQGRNYRIKRIGNFISINGKNYKVESTRLAQQKKSGQGDHNMSSPMPGKILKVLVDIGDEVKMGQGLIVMEAMKMEHTIKAAADGVVKNIYFKEGELVGGGVELLELENLTAKGIIKDKRSV